MGVSGRMEKGERRFSCTVHTTLFLLVYGVAIVPETVIPQIL